MAVDLPPISNMPYLAKGLQQKQKAELLLTLQKSMSNLENVQTSFVTYSAFSFNVLLVKQRMVPRE